MTENINLEDYIGHIGKWQIIFLSKKTSDD